MISAFESVTVGVRDVESALAVFRDRMGYRVEFDVRASVSLLSAWKLPVHEDVRLVTLSADGHGAGRIRLARYPDAGGATTRLDHGPGAADRPTDVGPKALDIYTGAPIGEAVDLLVAAGCEARGRPERFEIGSNDTEEVILTGPDGVPLLLMVGHAHLPGNRRVAPGAGRFSEVATLSVVAAGLDASRRFYEEALGYVHEATDVELRGEHRDAACRLFGVPMGTRVHVALYRERRQASGKFVLIHFYDRTTGPLAHPMRPGQLGISLISCRCGDLDALSARLGRAGGQVESVIQHAAVDEGTPCRVMLVRGPNGELFEFLER
jgi:catechol 2,3-dioxygenase-like lactoylglutathione lyase family enzyme